MVRLIRLAGVELTSRAGVDADDLLGDVFWCCRPAWNFWFSLYNWLADEVVVHELTTQGAVREDVVTKFMQPARVVLEVLTSEHTA